MFLPTFLPSSILPSFLPSFLAILLHLFYVMRVSKWLMSKTLVWLLLYFVLTKAQIWSRLRICYNNYSLIKKIVDSNSLDRKLFLWEDLTIFQVDRAWNNITPANKGLLIVEHTGRTRIIYLKILVRELRFPKNTSHKTGVLKLVVKVFLLYQFAMIYFGICIGCRNFCLLLISYIFFFYKFYQISN